jgi:hypothetical protein
MTAFDVYENLLYALAGCVGVWYVCECIQVHRRRLSQMQRNAPGRLYIVDHVYVRCYSGAQQAPQEVEILKNEKINRVP